MSEPAGTWGRYPWAKSGQRRALAALVAPVAGKSVVSLAERFATNIYRPGAVIFYRSHVPLACYLLRHGSVVLEFGHGNRAARGIVVEGPAILGHWHAVNAAAYPVTARAITAAVVALIPRADSGRLKFGASGELSTIGRV
ncbi:MAG: hypothetical protein AAB152_05350 [Candidatus Coatesbacteria bacterium]